MSSSSTPQWSLQLTEATPAEMALQACVVANVDKFNLSISPDSSTCFGDVISATHLWSTCNLMSNAPTYGVPPILTNSEQIQLQVELKVRIELKWPQSIERWPDTTHGSVRRMKAWKGWFSMIHSGNELTSKMPETCLFGQSSNVAVSILQIMFFVFCLEVPDVSW